MNGMVSNRVKRNISATLVFIGIMCIAGRAWDVVMAPESGKAWFKLCGIIILTYLCFDSFCNYRRLVKNGVVKGNR